MLRLEYIKFHFLNISYLLLLCFRKVGSFRSSGVTVRILLSSESLNSKIIIMKNDNNNLDSGPGWIR